MGLTIETGMILAAFEQSGLDIVRTSSDGDMQVGFDYKIALAEGTSALALLETDQHVKDRRRKNHLPIDKPVEEGGAGGVAQADQMAQQIFNTLVALVAEEHGAEAAEALKDKGLIRALRTVLLEGEEIDIKTMEALVLSALEEDETARNADGTLNEEKLEELTEERLEDREAIIEASEAEIPEESEIDADLADEMDTDDDDEITVSEYLSYLLVNAPEARWGQLSEEYAREIFEQIAEDFGLSEEDGFDFDTVVGDKANEDGAISGVRMITLVIDALNDTDALD